MVLNDKHFRRFLNAKKYMIMFTVTVMQYFYEVLLPLRQSHSRPDKWRHIFQGMRRSGLIDFEKQKERKKGYIESTFKKIEEYKDREDEQGQFFRNHCSFFPAAKLINSQYLELTRLEAMAAEYEQNCQLMTDSRALDELRLKQH